MRKSNRIKELRIYILVVLYCSLIIIFSGLITGNPDGAVELSEQWSVSAGEKAIESAVAPIYYSGSSKDFSEGVYRLEYFLNLNSEYIESMKRPVIVFPSIAGNGIQADFQ